MVLYFILIVVEPLKEYLVYNCLSKMDEVVEVHPLFGDYDMLIKMEIKTVEKASELILNKIRGIDGIVTTKTLTGLN